MKVLNNSKNDLILMSLEHEMELRAVEINGLRELRSGNYAVAESLFRKEYSQVLLLH